MEEEYLEREVIALALDTAAGASRLDKLKALKARLQSRTDDPLLQPSPSPGPKVTNRDTRMHDLLSRFSR